MYFILSLFIFLSSFSYSMDLIDLSQSKKVQEEVDLYFNDTLPKLKLSQLAKSYRDLSDDVKSVAVKRMSYQACLLHAISLCLPKDVQKYIYTKMLGSNEKVVEKLYTQDCMLEVFATCADIITVIGKGKPIGFLYEELPDKRKNIFNEIDVFKKHQDMMIKGSLFNLFGGSIITQKELSSLPSLSKDISEYVEPDKVYVASSCDEDLMIMSGLVGCLFCCMTGMFSFITCINSCFMAGVCATGSSTCISCTCCGLNMGLRYKIYHNQRLEIDQ